MKYYEFELEEETIKLRLTSNDCIEIEKKTGVKLLDFIQDYSMQTIVTLLMYMRRSSIPNYSLKDASELYDKLIDSEAYGSMEKIIYDVIFEGLVVSGFLKKEDLEAIKQTQAEKKAEKKIPQATQK